MKCPNPECIGLEVKTNELFCPWCGQRRYFNLSIEERRTAKSASGWSPIQRFFAEEYPELRAFLAVADDIPETISCASLSTLQVRGKWLQAGEWQSVPGGYAAKLTYRPDDLPQEAKTRAVALEVSLPLTETTVLSAPLAVYPRPSYALEAKRDEQGNVRLLKGEDGNVDLDFYLCRFGPTVGLCVRVQLPSSLPLAIETNGKRQASSSDIPNLWGDSPATKGRGALASSAHSSPSVANSLSAQTTSAAPGTLWNTQNVEINWRGSARSKRRPGTVTYKVSGGDSDPYDIKFNLTYRGRIGSDEWRPYEFTQELSLPVRIVGRPALKVLGSVGRTSWSVLTNRREDFTTAVELTNGGRDSQLIIKGVRLGNVPADLKVALSGSIVAGANIVNVRGQADVQRVLLHLQEMPAVGNYTFELIFSYIDPVALAGETFKEYSRLVGLRVGQPQTLPGSVLAVDFGTSSSCVAIWGVGSARELIPVEDNELALHAGGDPYSLSSLILYAKERTTLGEAARLLSYRYPLALVSAPKRAIGKREYFEVLPVEQTWSKISVDAVVSEFYRVLICRAQDSVVLRQRATNNDWNCCNFENLAISHPSRFNFAQKQMMAKAASRAFAEVFGGSQVNQELVQEPLAAALAYVSDNDVQERWHDSLGSDDITYTMLVYDCGGGTTDLCCLEIHSRRNRCQIERCNDFAQLTKEQRQRLLPIAIRQLAPLRSEAELVNWAQRIESCDDWLWAWNEHDELRQLPFAGEDLLEVILSCANEAQESDSFTVDVCIRGASGDPLFGGANVTDEIASLLRERFPNLVVDESGEDDKKVKARRNIILLQRLAEQLKCNVSNHDDTFLAALVDGQRDGTLVTVQGPVKDEELRNQLAAVNKNLYKRLRYASGGSQTHIANLSDECLALSERCFGTSMPQVILLTGRGSQWPGIRESLVLKFPGVPVELLGDGNSVKHCVAQGAGVLALVKSGAKLAVGPGVHIVDVREDVYTTASLCLQCGVQMTELIGAGSRFTTEGTICGRRSWRLTPGESAIAVSVYLSDVPGPCQNRGEAASREGVSKLETFIVDVPLSAGTDGTICLELRPASDPGFADLRVRFEIAGQRYEGHLADGTASLAVMILNK